MKTIQFSALIEKCKANKDKTLDITISTQELAPEDTAHIFSLFERQIWCALAETELTKQDIDIPEKLVEKGQKTPSQRFRDRLFVYWQSTYKQKTGFDQYYERILDELGQHYLDKLQ